jgi:hypothetical protein
MYSVCDVCQYREYSMSRWHGGKGSKRRPSTDSEAYDNGWDRIFNKKKEYVPSDADVIDHIQQEDDDEYYDDMNEHLSIGNLQ